MHKLAVDITGQRFGMLTALHPVDNVGGRTAWLCRCDCTREIVVKTYKLRAGRVTHCGCAHQDGLTYVDGTCVEVLRSKTVRRNNTSGVPGVDWRAKRNLWRASICFKGKRYYLGSFANFEDAVKARKKAEAEMHDTFVEEYSGAIS